MSRSRASRGPADPSAARPLPPGRVKIAHALRSLLETKEFGAITTAEIARTAGVTEALIYKYFQDKRDLLHQLLGEFLRAYLVRFRQDTRGIKGALNKLRKLIWSHINVYATDRVFARILLLEVRNHPDYYRSETYDLVRQYSNVMLEILEEGIRDGEIRPDLPAKFLRQVILGSLEHVCLTGVIFRREISPDELADDLCKFVFNGIEHHGVRP